MLFISIHGTISQCEYMDHYPDQHQWDRANGSTLQSVFETVTVTSVNVNGRKWIYQKLIVNVNGYPKRKWIYQHSPTWSIYFTYKRNKLHESW